MLAGVAIAAHGVEIIAAQLALGDRAVVALQPLLGHQLQAVVGRLLAALAVLAGTVFALVDRALGTAPQVDPEAAADLVLRIRAFAHATLLLLCPDRPWSTPAAGAGFGPGGPKPPSPEEAPNLL